MAEQNQDRRLLITVFLVGGLALAVLAQASLAQVLPRYRGINVLLLLYGAASFTFAGLLAGGGQAWPLVDRLAAGWRRTLPGLAGWRALLLGDALCLSLLAGLAAGDGLLALNLPVAVAAWLLGFGCLLLAVVPPWRPLAWPGRGEGLLLLAIFLVAFLLRAAALDRFPANLSGDEGSAGLHALLYLQGKADNPFGVGWFSFPALYFMVQSLGIALLGQTVTGLRIASALAGTLTVVGVYALGRSMFNRRTALLAAAFLAIFHFHIHFSRIGLNNIWDGLFAVTSTAAMWQGWRSGRRVWFLLAGLFLGLGLYFYVSIRVLPLLLLIWALGAALLDRPAFRHRVVDLALLALAALVVALPLLLFFQAHPQEFQAPLQRVTIFDGWLASQTTESPVAIILGQMLDTALGLTFLPLKLLYDPGAPLLLPMSAALFVLGLFWAATHFDLRYLLLLLPLLGVVVLGGLSLDPPASQRYIIAAPFVAVLVALPMEAAATWLAAAWPSWRPAIGLALVGLMAVIAWNNLRYYFVTVPERYLLGGHNTLVATQVAHYLQALTPGPASGPAVYFFGAPRMGYHSLATIPYLVPEVEGHDVVEPLVARPDWPIEGPTRFIFLPERASEMRYVRAVYPGGRQLQVDDKNGQTLFLVYEWPPVGGP